MFFFSPSQRKRNAILTTDIMPTSPLQLQRLFVLKWEIKYQLTPQRNINIPWCSCKILGTVNLMLEFGPYGSKRSSLEINPFLSRVQTSISSWQYANVQWPGYRQSFPTATSETAQVTFQLQPWLVHWTTVMPLKVTTVLVAYFQRESADNHQWPIYQRILTNIRDWTEWTITFANVIRSNILGFCWSWSNELPCFV